MTLLGLGCGDVQALAHGRHGTAVGSTMNTSVDPVATRRVERRLGAAVDDVAAALTARRRKERT
jgi:hypothetical protein